MLLTLVALSTAHADSDLPTGLPPILGLGAKPCSAVKERPGFAHPSVIEWVNGFLTGMESARVSYLQIWGRDLGAATPGYILRELDNRCVGEMVNEPLAVIATKILEDLPGFYPEDEF